MMASRVAHPIPSVDATPHDVGGVVNLSGNSPVYAGFHCHDGGYPHHQHSFLEIAVVVGGTGLHVLDEEARRIRTGDVMMVPDGVGHSYFDCDGLQLFNLCINSSALTHELSWIWSDPLLRRLLDSSSPRLAHLRSTDTDTPVDLIRGLALGRLPDRGSARAEAVAATLAMLCRLTRASEPVSVDFSSGQVGARAARRLRQEFAAPWTLESLAASLHVSERHLTASFRALHGTSPMSFLAEIRMEEAVRLLTATSLSVSSIAALIGIADPNYFARRFRRFCGERPSDYRQRFSPSAIESSASSAIAVDPETVK